MNFIDTHTHLYLKDFDHDIDEEIKKSIDLGVKEFYLPSIDNSYTNRMIKLKNKYPNEIKLMMGLHPTHIDANYLIEINHVKKMLDEYEFSAVGEIGIMNSRDKKMNFQDWRGTEYANTENTDIMRNEKYRIQNP